MDHVDGPEGNPAPVLWGRRHRSYVPCGLHNAAVRYLATEDFLRLWVRIFAKSLCFLGWWPKLTNVAATAAYTAAVFVKPNCPLLRGLDPLVGPEPEKDSGFINLGRRVRRHI
jgi:hypothetical protein